MSESRMSKVGKLFQREMNDIKALRRLDIDKDLPREISTERLTDGIVKLPEWKDSIKPKLIKEPRDIFKDKTGGFK